MTRVTVWNEYFHEKHNQQVAKIYPEGIHNAVADFLKLEGRFTVRTATLDEPEAGLPQEILDETDVLLWWGHKLHDQVPDETARRVQSRVLEGMGFIALHSAHLSKPFRALMGTNCTLRWRKAGEKERLWNIAPSHPIAQGIGEYFEIEHTEMYGERFDIPEPEKLLFISWYPGGEVMRSGCTWTRGNGRIFFFKPGHETFPIYKNADVQRVIKNAVAWAAASVRIPWSCPNTEPLEPIDILDC